MRIVFSLYTLIVFKLIWYTTVDTRTNLADGERLKNMGLCIETERLRIREFKKQDKRKLHTICSEAYILKWMPDWNITLEQREKWIEWIQQMYTVSTKENVRIMMAIELKENNELIGMIGVGNKEEVNNEVEIAYFISESQSNKGYMSEAGIAMSHWAVDQFHLDYLIAIVELDNYPSQKVVEKAGFNKISKKYILNSGEEQEKPYYYYRFYNPNLNTEDNR